MTKMTSRHLHALGRAENFLESSIQTLSEKRFKDKVALDITLIREVRHFVSNVVNEPVFDTFCPS